MTALPRLAAALPLALALALAAPGLAPAAAPASISGVVAAVDLDGRTLTVKDPKAGEVVVLVPDGAVIVLDGDEQAVLEDVFEGDVVEHATVREAGQGKLALVKAVISTAPEEDEDDAGGAEAPPAEPAPPSPPPPRSAPPRLP
ncbi:MAG: hypothetical protein MUF27_01220 [Acidobacteria bacterium]|nr:hypothetical protein [Acidobacteriota bacterium]